MNHCLHPLEFTSTSYFLILKIWRPPLILHSPLFGGRDYIKKIIWVSECIQFIEKIFFLIFNLIDLFLYGNLYCGLLFRPQCLSSIFNWKFREGAKFIETGAWHSGTGAVTFFNTVNHGALTFFDPENHGA